MGVVENISHESWPRQYEHVGKRADVTFHYDTARTIPGVVVRDDAEAPWETIIRLDDGRFVRASECQYHVRSGEVAPDVR